MYFPTKRDSKPIPARNGIFDPFMFPFFFGEDAPECRKPARPPHPHDMMKTDLTELADKFVLDINLPGFSKDDIKIELKDGALEISAEKNETKEENDETGKVIKKERYTGRCMRRFAIDWPVEQDAIKASFKDGVLNIEVAKPEEEKKEEEEKVFISIQ